MHTRRHTVCEGDVCASDSRATRLRACMAWGGFCFPERLCFPMISHRGRPRRGRRAVPTCVLACASCDAAACGGSRAPSYWGGANPHRALSRHAMSHCALSCGMRHAAQRWVSVCAGYGLLTLTSPHRALSRHAMSHCALSCSMRRAAQHWVSVCAGYGLLTLSSRGALAHA